MLIILAEEGYTGRESSIGQLKCTHTVYLKSILFGRNQVLEGDYA